MDKVIKDGMVAVLVSPNFGSGWSTYASGVSAEEMMYCPEIVEFILTHANEREGLTLEQYKELKKIARKLFPEQWLLGLGGIMVEWIPVGTKFYIDEYDGSETLVKLDTVKYFIA